MREQSHKITHSSRHYDHLAPHYEARWPAYLGVQTDWVLGHWPLAESGSVLDLGCGTGSLLGRINSRRPNLRLTGVDSSPGMLSEAKKSLAAATLIEGNLEDTSFVSRLPQADIVLSLSVLHHLNDIDRHLRLLGELAKPAATIFLSSFARDGLTMRLADSLFRWQHHNYRASLPHTVLLEKVGRFFPHADVISNILRPDWFWRIQIFKVSLAG